MKYPSVDRSYARSVLARDLEPRLYAFYIELKRREYIRAEQTALGDALLRNPFAWLGFIWGFTTSILGVPLTLILVCLLLRSCL